ncbi:MAG: hypothetical protein L6R45_35405 [Anaerolineae bacterium]|nr:hypothetical protein [Anaerolineae bacterium]
MNGMAHQSSLLSTLTMLTGLIVFILALAVVFFAMYILLQTGQSILGNITFTSIGWPYP